MMSASVTGQMWGMSTLTILLFHLRQVSLEKLAAVTHYVGWHFRSARGLAVGVAVTLPNRWSG
ncbi:hypothetical protein I41_38690 [Lacipirellula limnantheis]|uniref:Uncharacterized protein n=1 Tax=Lacipirellula limnantheis TaxID=2528024 RepID=A0A517U229_9BACT|nr:hypothetical protein I41_38690 [Lacipirellula limnantheis]